jgi:predicted nuclease of predicted toxin-antitoxin system
LKLKLDENLGHRAQSLLKAGGHDVATVYEESLCSASDNEVIQVSRREERCLVTLDLEFGNPLRYRSASGRTIAPSLGALGRSNVQAALPNYIKLV